MKSRKFSAKLFPRPAGKSRRRGNAGSLASKMPKDRSACFTPRDAPSVIARAFLALCFPSRSFRRYPNAILPFVRSRRRSAWDFGLPVARKIIKPRDDRYRRGYRAWCVLWAGEYANAVANAPQNHEITLRLSTRAAIASKVIARWKESMSEK